MMIIILEGVDATGKSTLADALRSEYGGVIEHYGPPNLHPLAEYSFPIQRAGLFDITVYDRFHWGELVYGPHYRGETKLGIEGFTWIELALESRGAVTVATTGDPTKIFERVTTLKDDFVRIDLDHLTQLQHDFLALRPHALTPIFEHNIDHGPLVDIHALHKLVVSRGSTRQSIVAWHPEYIGPPRPHALLVGDRAGQEGRDGHLFPFAPYPGGSGRHLMRALIAGGLQRQVGLVNAYSAIEGNLQNLVDLVSWLGRPRVVALGDTAADALTRLRLEFVKVKHPQYMRRFHHHDVDAYAQMITEAMK